MMIVVLFMERHMLQWPSHVVLLVVTKNEPGTVNSFGPPSCSCVWSSEGVAITSTKGAGSAASVCMISVYS